MALDEVACPLQGFACLGQTRSVPMPVVNHLRPDIDLDRRAPCPGALRKRECTWSEDLLLRELHERRRQSAQVAVDRRDARVRRADLSKIQPESFGDRSGVHALVGDTVRIESKIARE